MRMALGALLGVCWCLQAHAVDVGDVEREFTKSAVAQSLTNQDINPTKARDFLALFMVIHQDTLTETEKKALWYVGGTLQRVEGAEIERSLPRERNR